MPAPLERGPVVVRGFEERDVAMAMELARDEYSALLGTLPLNATSEHAADWIAEQRSRACTGVGYGFAIANRANGVALGQIGLILTQRSRGRASAGYAVAPSARGRGVAADALGAVTDFAWTIPEVHRIELYIEPSNTASVRTAEVAGYVREGLLRSYQELGGRRRDMYIYASIRPR